MSKCQQNLVTLLNGCKRFTKVYDPTMCILGVTTTVKARVTATTDSSGATNAAAETVLEANRSARVNAINLASETHLRCAAATAKPTQLLSMRSVEETQAPNHLPILLPIHQQIHQQTHQQTLQLQNHLALTQSQQTGAIANATMRKNAQRRQTVKADACKPVASVVR